MANHTPRAPQDRTPTTLVEWGELSLKVDELDKTLLAVVLALETANVKAEPPQAGRFNIIATANAMIAGSDWSTRMETKALAEGSLTL